MTEVRSLLRIAICDGDPADRKLIRTYLKQIRTPEIVLMEAASADDLNAILDKGTIDLILFDLHMPGKPDFTPLAQIIERNIAPVAVMSGLGSEEIAVRALYEGAVSYLPKSRISFESLKDIIEEALQRWNAIQRGKANQEELEKLANIDSLTGLYNRRVILRELGYYSRFANRYQDALSLIMMDIDHFKMINDRYGHLIGDAVLAAMASLIRGGTRDTDVIGRYGGEEFLIVLPRTNGTTAGDVAERIRKHVEETAMHFTDISPFHITVSLGVCAHEPGDDERELISRADRALYAAKAHGRNRVEMVS